MNNDTEFYYKKDENYTIVGLCMEVHRILSPGLLEIVYKDALEIEFKNHNIPYVREQMYDVEYKGFILPHNFYADFVVYEDIILEVKSASEVTNDHLSRTLNYMKLAKTPIGIIVNFQNKSLTHKRLIST
ncbi:GxxExxY protein [Flavobacterium sp.]|uniref:GxxExxY protein n=1 Tax=Flavobacterium sp. TaxID=239 RepID=UPI003753B2FD